MKLLLQKYHGLPGIGVNGKDGNAGIKGESIYFDFFNNFFDGMFIEIDLYVYAAKNIYNHYEDRLFDASNATAMTAVANKELDVYSKNNSSFLKNAVINSSNDNLSYLNFKNVFYTGSQLTSDDVNHNIIVGDDSTAILSLSKEVELDINGDLLTMGFMIYSLYNQDNKDEFIQYNTENDQYTVKNINENNRVYPNKKYNITNRGTYYKFDDDAKIYMNKLVDGNWEIDLSYDTNDAIYINSSSIGEAFEKGTDFILNFIDTSNYLAAIPENSSIFYISENILSSSLQKYYVLDANIYYAELTNSSLSVFKTANNSSYIELNESSEDALYWNAFYKTSFNDNALAEKYPDDLKDSNGNQFYGLASPLIFSNKGTTDVSLNIDAFRKYTSEYYKRYLSAKTYPAYLRNNTGLAIYYEISDDTKSMFIPTNLKSTYKTGDVLYFYINIPNFENIDSQDYQKIQYMVEITDNLVGCNPELLMMAAQKIKNPFEIKYFLKYNNRLISHNAVGVLNKPCVSNSSTSLSNKGFITISDICNYPPVLLGIQNGENTNVFNSFCSISKNISTNNSNYLLIGEMKNNSFNISLNNGVLKFNNFGINQNNISNNTNVELYNSIYDKNIKFYENLFIKPLLDIDLYYADNNENAAVFACTINANDYFYNIEMLTDYFYGCDIYNENMEKINTLSSTSDTLYIELVPFIDNHVYYILMFASHYNGLKYYSKLTKISITYETYLFYENPKDIILPRTYYTKAIGEFSVKKRNSNTNMVKRQRISSYNIKIEGDDQSIVKEKKKGNILFVLSDITAEQSNASLNIYSDDASIKILNIIFNRSENSSSYFKTDWINISVDTLATSSNNFKYNLNLSTNLPPYNTSILPEYNYVIKNKLVDYIKLGSSTNIDEDGECDLFENLSKNDYKIPETYLRSVLVTAAYKFDGSNEIFYENFNIILPGLKDTRDFPNIKLNIHDKIELLLSYNTIENGVLCNQFVTYMDIDINDFKQKWGKFLSSDVSTILFNCDIKSFNYDLEWQNKYYVLLITPRATFRAINENSSNFLNNYIKLSAYIFKSSDNLLNKNTANYNDKSIALSNGGSINLNSRYNFTRGFFRDEIFNKIDNYILCNEDFIEISKSSNIIDLGILHDLAISLRDIPLEDNINNIKLKLIIEFGNPIISNIYYRFFVSNANIKVVFNDNSSCYFYSSINDKDGLIHDTYLAKINSTYVNNITNVSQVMFKYISNIFDATINPLSYITCPADIELQYSNIYDYQGQKYGISEQILTEFKFYNSSVYLNSSTYDANIIKHNKIFPFENLNIKKSYILDNIKALRTYPISLYNTFANTNTSTYALNTDSSLKNHYVLDFIDGNKYLSIVYNSNILRSTIKNDEYVFNYNKKKYFKYKYNQKNNNMPVFVYDEKSIVLRNNSLIKAMEKWNDYYTAHGQYESDNTYQGILSLYGNGYMYLLENDIKNTSINYMSLNKVIELNNETINLLKSVNEINVIPTKNDLPDNGQYLRGILYDINWEFPLYYNINNSTGINPYRIVSAFDNLLNNVADPSTGKLPEDSSVPLEELSASSSETTYWYQSYLPYQEYYTTLKNDSSSLYEGRMIPYSLLFDILPRIAYNYENNGINIFMLRKPSIGIDTDNISSEDVSTKYNFNNRLFELTNFSKLKSPYKIK